MDEMFGSLELIEMGMSRQTLQVLEASRTQFDGMVSEQ